MRTVERLLIPAFAVAIAASLAAAATATAPEPQDLPVTFAACPQAPSARLHAGATYQASRFPLPLRLTPPDSTWSGGQRKSGSTGCHTTGRGVGHAPYYGWVAAGQGPAARPQRGSIVIMTSYAWTPSVTAAATVLRTGEPGSGVEATVQATSRVKLAGFSGVKFDGQVVGPSHWFFAFSSPHGAKGDHPDGVQLAQGSVVRIIALNVRGKTVVIYITNGALTAGQFPAFLTKANRILRTLAFPKGG